MQQAFKMRIVALPLLAVLALPLTACQTGPSNRSMDSVHQPVVSRTDYVFDIHPDANGELSADEIERLDGWFASIGLGYGDRVSIDNPGPYSNARLKDEIAPLLGQYGLLLSDIAPATVGHVPAGSVRVVVSHSVASVPGCPDWRTKQESDLVGGTSSNFGCAVNSNLAAMVANPQDLVLGQPGSISRSPTEGTKAIKTYQQKANTGAGDLKTLTAGGSN
ncbi:CpaD family pilus assembly lipoprotein [Rhizorhapis sp. SPR117]|uniref:CpaD family pilus assembly lipoprotein n=1 Tax=Rhizorhapis sp. SPR117 TaxID=2912611 RepID=UPI001F34F094|nr:CpaD family pilus assembly protein [Rhizorhapis sp. SPR117]